MCVRFKKYVLMSRPTSLSCHFIPQHSRLAKYLCRGSLNITVQKQWFALRK